MKIKFEIECRSCNATGLYSGMVESKGIAVICRTCKGTGKEIFEMEYEPFIKRKTRSDIKRVYKKGTAYKLGLGKINFNGIGVIDMDKEGISYEDFLKGKEPEHIKKLECPMMADQQACHDVKGFINYCWDKGCTTGCYIPRCPNQKNKHLCWEEFDKFNQLTHETKKED